MPDESTTLAVVVSRIDDLREDIAQLRAEATSNRDTLVSRGEWGQRNQHVDTRLNSHGREIGDLRAELRARRLPWPSVLAAVLAAVALAAQLIPQLAT